MNIKKDARLALRWCWGRAVAILLTAAGLYLLVSLIEGLCYRVADILPAPYPEFTYEGLMEYFIGLSPAACAITGAAALITVAVQVPLSIGCRLWYLHMVGGESNSILMVFSLFSTPSSYFRSLGFALLLALKKLGWALLFAGPGAALAFFMANTGPHGLFPLDIGPRGPLLFGWAALAGCAMAVLGLLLWLVVVQRYFLAPYYVAEGRSLSEAFALSAQGTKGVRVELFLFELSFIGWWALCFFVLPGLFSLPYHSASSAIYSRYLMERQARGSAQ